jgi:hypothetical protein
MEPSFTNTIMFCPQKSYKTALFSWNRLLQLLDPAVILYGCRCNVLVTFHAVVFETYACWGSSARDLQDKYSNLAPIL